MSVECNLVKIYLKLDLFYESNIWFANKTIVKRMKNLQRKSLKWLQSSSHFTDKNTMIGSINLLPNSNQLVFTDLVVLNKISASKFLFRGEQFQQTRNGHPKTRSTKQVCFFAKKKRLHFLSNENVESGKFLYDLELLAANFNPSHSFEVFRQNLYQGSNLSAHAFPLLQIPLRHLPLSFTIYH